MSRIEDQANYYKNYHLRYRNILGVIHLENEDDKRFWAYELQNVKAGDYHFISQSKSERGRESKGCEQCLKYIPYLNRNFFICIDSDLRLLRGAQGLVATKYIAQTHTYSWENHSCEATHLERRFKQKLPDSEFSFIGFLKNLSEIVYLPLLYLVHYGSPELNTQWNVSKFNKCMPTQLRREELANNGELYLQRLKQRFESEFNSLTIPENFSIDSLTPENAYLHIQGHQLYSLILNIGTLLCKGKGVAFKSDVLDDYFPISGYAEIDDVQSDLSFILRED